jgi:hypothetical protein
MIRANSSSYVVSRNVVIAESDSHTSAKTAHCQLTIDFFSILIWWTTTHSGRYWFMYLVITGVEGDLAPKIRWGVISSHRRQLGKLKTGRVPILLAQAGSLR